MKFVKIIILLTIVFSSQTFSQEYDQESIDLLMKATHYYNDNQIVLAFESVLSFLDRYPNANVARNMISSLLGSNFQTLSMHPDLIKRAIPYFSTNNDAIVLAILLKYDEADGATLQKLLLTFSTFDPEKVKVPAQVLNKMDYSKNPKLAEKIYKILFPYLVGEKIDLINAYYYLRRPDKVNEILNYYKKLNSENIIEDTVLAGSISKLINNLDMDVDPKTYFEIFKTFTPFMSKDNYLSLAILYYNSSQFARLDALISNLDMGLQIPQNISVNDILKLNTEIDNNRFRKLFPYLLKNVSADSLNSISDIFRMYELSKKYFAAGYSEETLALMKKINDTISNEIQDMRTYMIWGFSCVATNENFRAQKLFDNVATFGTSNDLKYLGNEFKWWHHYNLNQEELNKYLALYFHKIETIPIVNQSETNIENNTKTENDNAISASYYSLIIAVQEYENDKLNLRYPISDSEQLFNVLTTKYIFPKENVIFLRDPKRKEIIKALSDLRKKLNENDNLLIYYAGHGQWDEELNQGFWLPSDAEPNDISNWISNSDIRDYLKAIHTKHSLLIADACFSGGIFKTREVFADADKTILELYNSSSRKAITSGYIKSVPDKSVFLQYLVKSLNDNKEKYIGAERLYLSFRDAVTNNSPLNQTPLYGVIWDSGDEGGDFIFVQK